MKFFYIIISLVLICHTSYAQAVSGETIYTQGGVNLTREIPDVRHSWIFNQESMSDGDTLTGTRLFSISQGRFFSVWVKADTVSGTPDFSLYVLGSFDDDINKLGRDLEGTYEIVENCTDADEWLFHYVSPSPCSSVTAKVVANSGSGDFKISVVFFKTGS